MTLSLEAPGSTGTWPGSVGLRPSLDRDPSALDTPGAQHAHNMPCPEVLAAEPHLLNHGSSHHGGPWRPSPSALQVPISPLPSSSVTASWPNVQHAGLPLVSHKGELIVYPRACHDLGWGITAVSQASRG